MKGEEVAALARQNNNLMEDYRQVYSPFRFLLKFYFLPSLSSSPNDFVMKFVCFVNHNSAERFAKSEASCDLLQKQLSRARGDNNTLIQELVRSSFSFFITFSIETFNIRIKIVKVSK